MDKGEEASQLGKRGGNLFKRRQLVGILGVILGVVFLTVVLAGCGGLKGSEEAPSQDSSWEEEKGSASPDMDYSEGGERSYSPQDNYWQDKKIIYNAELTVYVNEFETAAEKLEAEVHRLRGYIADSRVYNYKEGVPSGSWTIRVPADKFYLMLDFLMEMGRWENKNIYTDDVTQQYIDLEARIRSLGEEEERLLEILDMAETVSEVLEVERELGRVRQEKESLQTQFDYLKQDVEYSSINVYMEEEVGQKQLTGSGLNNLGSRIYRSFLASLDFLLTVLGSLLVFLFGRAPILIIIALFVFLIYLFAKKYRHPSN